MKKLLCLVMAFAVSLIFCSCSTFGVNVDDSIEPPKPSGELYNIQKTLEKYAGNGISLVYPSSGKYRSAIVTEDIDGDGWYDVFSFYSTKTDDKTTVMHINYIRRIEDEWVSVSDLQVNSSGVDSIDFVRLDKSSTPCVLVNWNRISALDKQLSVYRTDNGSLTEVTSAEHSVYAVCDFNNTGISDIIAVRLDAENFKSAATLLSLGTDGFIQSSICRLDGHVTNYYEPKVTKLTDGSTGVFIDADKSTGMITEALILKDGELSELFELSASGENTKTLRASEVRSEDIDGDGMIDIPTAQKLPSVSGIPGTNTDTVYLTTWNSVGKGTLTPIARQVINYSDGYSFTVPDSWVGSFTVARLADQRQRTLLRWDSEAKTEGEEILRFRVVTIKEWDENRSGFAGYNEIARDSDCVYIVRLGNSAMNPGMDYFKNNFRLINAVSSVTADTMNRNG